MVSTNDYDELRIWEIVILLLTGLAGSMHGLYIYRVVTTEEGGRRKGGRRGWMGSGGEEG
jgi:hypothetical protein